MQVSANGINFVCQIDGPESAPWLTFSNSLNTNFSLWDEQVALLSDRYRVLRYNTRGHDGTGTPPGPWSLEDLASDIIALWDELGIAKSHFVGLSIGGMTGQALALGWPDRISAYVLADTRADFTGEFAQTVPALIDKVVAEGLDPLVAVMPLRWFAEEVRAATPRTCGTRAPAYRDQHGRRLCRMRRSDDPARLHGPAPQNRAPHPADLRCTGYRHPAGRHA